MFFAHFITTWIDKRNKFHFSANSNVSDVNPVRKGGALNPTSQFG
jgi:hypothetical protein